MGTFWKRKIWGHQHWAGRYDTEHMEKPRSWRPGGFLWVHKRAKHAQAYIDELWSNVKGQNVKPDIQWEKERTGTVGNWERQMDHLPTILWEVKRKKPKQCGSHYPLLREGGQPTKGWSRKIRVAENKRKEILGSVSCQMSLSVLWKCQLEPGTAITFYKQVRVAAQI